MADARPVDLSVVVLECRCCTALYCVDMTNSPPQYPECPDCEIELADEIVAHDSGIFERVR